MAAAAFLTRSRADAVCRTPARASAVVVVAVIEASFCKSALSRVLNEGRGKSTSARTMSASGARSRSTDASARPRLASTSTSSRSTRARSDIGTLDPRAQALQRAELELLHSALGAVQAARDLANASLLHEPLDDDAALVGRQPVDEAKKISTPIRGVRIRRDARL